MLQLPLQSLSLTVWIGAVLLFGLLLLFAKAVYNLVFHPLSRVPGPFWARASGVPSWYHALRGDRHLWLWQQFQIYGDRIRPEPDSVVFYDEVAFADIYSTKSNVRRSPFYMAFKRSHNAATSLTTIDVAGHAKKRKLINQAFTEKSLRAACTFIIQHVDRWNQLLVEGTKNDGRWSETVDFSETVDTLVFDILGDLGFGKSFDIKEPGDNPLKVIPHSITKNLQFYYPMCRSPFLKLLLWLKPRGLDQFFERMAPPAARQFAQFVLDSVTDRIALHKKQAERPEDERRLDMFYFLMESRDPDTGKDAYTNGELRAEASLLIIAGSGTTAISLSGIFFYLTGDPVRCERLTNEIRNTFPSADDIVLGPKLSGCTYLKACIDEGMRLSPAGLCEMPREVLPGGCLIKNEFYPAGTIVGTVPWAFSRNTEVWGDADVFRPERWIVDEAAGVSKESVARLRSIFHPFLSGPTNCVGKNLAMAEMMITVARTLHRLDVRRTPGSTFGGGSPELGWGASDPNQFHMKDAYISVRHGPEVQFRRRGY